MSRFPLPSRWTLLVEFVIVSISPVPKLEPAPVSYIHCGSIPDPAAPLKSSLKVVDQPEGAPGTVSGVIVRAVSLAARAGDTAGPEWVAGAAAAAGAAADT